MLIRNITNTDFPKRDQVQRLSQGAPLGADGASVDCGASVHPPSLEMLGETANIWDLHGFTLW